MRISIGSKGHDSLGEMCGIDLKTTSQLRHAQAIDIRRRVDTYPIFSKPSQLILGHIKAQGKVPAFKGTFGRISHQFAPCQPTQHPLGTDVVDLRPLPHKEKPPAREVRRAKMKSK